jgi:CRP-like cAMP-binding protein
VLGTALFMGGNSAPSSAVVQTAGLGYRLKAHVLQEEFHRGGTTQKLLLRYMQALAVHVGQTAVCNRHHSIEQQLCRWLLSTLDRLPSNQVVMTQELVAGILGVRRESVTAAAGKLQRDAVLNYRRGHISVVSRPGLEAAVCECYRVVKHQYTRLRSDTPVRQEHLTAEGCRSDAVVAGS